MTDQWKERWDKAARSLSPHEYEKWVAAFVLEPGCPSGLVEILTVRRD